MYTNEACACSMFGLASRMTNVDTTRIPSQSVQSTYLAVFVVSVSRSRRRNEAIPYSRFGDDEPRIGGGAPPFCWAGPHMGAGAECRPGARARAPHPAT